MRSYHNGIGRGRSMTLTSRSVHVCDPKRLALVRFVCPYSYVAQDPTLRGIARTPAINTAPPQSTSYAPYWSGIVWPAARSIW